MSEEKKGQGTGIGVGSSSILVIFVVLCLTAFATLSMTSANADYRLTQRLAENTTAFYRADAQAEEKLAQLAILTKNTPPSQLGTALVEAGFTWDIPPGKTQEAMTVSYDIAMEGGKHLHVLVEAATLKRLCWQVQLAPELSQSQNPPHFGNLPSLPSA